MPVKIKEACKTPNRLDQRRKFPCHIIHNNQTTKHREPERILKGAKKNEQGRPIRIIPCFSRETLKDRKLWTGGLRH